MKEDAPRAGDPRQVRPPVAIVVLNYNRPDDLAECLDSIFENDYPNFEVIVVDNSSRSASFDVTKWWAVGPGKREPGVVHEIEVAAGGEADRSAGDIGCCAGPDDDTGGRAVSGRAAAFSPRSLTFFRSQVNLGFAGGHNMGIRLAVRQGAKFVFVANSDIVVAPDFLSRLVDAAEQNGAAAVGPAVLAYEHKDIVWQAGGTIDPVLGWARRNFEGEHVDAIGREPFEVSYLAGCAMLLRAEALVEIGSLEPAYFLYFEDADWFARAGKRGLKALLVPRSVVWHKENALSSQAKSAYSSYYFARNRLEFVRRNYPSYLLPALAAGLRYGILNNLLKRRWHDLAAALRGTADFLVARRGMVVDPGGARLLPNFLVLSSDYKPQPGGIAEHAYEVGRGLAARGAEVTVLAPGVPGARRFDQEHGFKTYRVPRIPVIEAVAYFLVGCYAVLNHRIGVVYVATSYPCALVCRLMRIFIHFRYTVTIHAHEVVYTGRSLRSRVKSVLRPLQVAAIASGDRVFAVSEFTRAALVKAGVADPKIATIFNGIDVEDLELDADVPGVTKRFGLVGKRVILTVARLDIHKGHDVVLRALPSIAARVPDAVYVIVGEGRMRGSLEALTRELGLGDRVVFTGEIPRPDVVALFKACDVFVMLSRIEAGSVEGFGIVFLEAGALGKPVVGGRSGGIPDAVEDGVTGILVDPSSTEEAADAITRILLDGQLAGRLGSAGSARTRSRFTWRKVVDSILASLNAPGR